MSLAYEGTAPDIGAYEFNGELAVEKEGALKQGKRLYIVNNRKGILITLYGSFSVIGIYDVSGRRLGVLPVNEQTGAHRILWDGRNVLGMKCAQGCYVVCLQTNERRISERFVLSY